MSTTERNIRLKRIYDEPSPEDGRRILATRYWPRGVPKSAVDEYMTKVSPSRELLREFKHEGLTWDEYVPRFLEEMSAAEAQSEISRLANLASSETITLMCICPDEKRCHRSLVKKLILQALPQSKENNP